VNRPVSPLPRAVLVAKSGPPVLEAFAAGVRESYGGVLSFEVSPTPPTGSGVTAVAITPP
jgi:hypothetical protein